MPTRSPRSVWATRWCCDGPEGRHVEEWPTTPLSPHIDGGTAGDWCVGATPLRSDRPLPQSRIVRPAASVLKAGVVVAVAGLGLVGLLSLGALADSEPIDAEGWRSLMFLFALPPALLVALAGLAMTRPRSLEVHIVGMRVVKRERGWWREAAHDQPLSAYTGLALHRALHTRARRRLFEPRIQARSNDTSALLDEEFTRYWIELRHAHDPAASVVLQVQDDGAPPLDALGAWSQRLGRPVLSTGGARRLDPGAGARAFAGQR